jgi:hypothetical protein
MIFPRSQKLALFILWGTLLKCSCYNENKIFLAITNCDKNVSSVQKYFSTGTLFMMMLDVMVAVLFS